MAFTMAASKVHDAGGRRAAFTMALRPRLPYPALASCEESAMRASKAGSGFAILGAVACAACGPAPYTIGPEEPAPAAEASPGPVQVIVGQTRPTEDRWIPDGLPRPNPFARSRTWVGEYDCPQGRTGLTLRIIDVRGKLVRAVFDFHHAPSGAAGQFIIGGAYDEDSRRMVFEPGPWIIHPDRYEPVGMAGQVSLDGAHFAGRITEPGCAGFRLHAAR
jgi:hypothetical protein